MRHSGLLAGMLAVAAFMGCRSSLEEEAMSSPPPPPAAAIAPVRDTMSLDRKLERLERELDAALHGRLEGQSLLRMLRAEAITDRLLEAAPPFAWLAEDYSVEARLRELQALADRVIAQVRRGEQRDRVLQDVVDLRRHVVELRSSLAAPGGGEAPPSLDSLLASVPADSATTHVSEGATGE